MEQNARLTLAVLLFPDFFQDFTLVNDLAATPVLPDRAAAEQLAKTNNPELRAAYLSHESPSSEVIEEGVLNA
jgi:hypothetical protein